MFETIWWFIFKDNRVGLPGLRANSTPTLLVVLLLNLGLSVAFFATASFNQPQTRFIELHYFKFGWEIFNAVFMMPFLLLKSYQKYNFDPKNPKEQFVLALYLRSRILERALGLTVPGLVELIFGFFNLAWAVATASNYVQVMNFGDTSKAIISIFMGVDLLAFVIILVFTVFIMFVKIRGVYQGTVNIKRILQNKIHLN